MKKRVIALCVVMAMAMTSLTGCIKIVKTGEEAALTGETQFSAGDDVAGFWESQAIPELTEKAVELTDFLNEAKGDFKSLADKYRKYSMGTSGELTYTVKGTGTISEINTESKAGTMTITLDGYTGSEDIKIQVGSVIKGSSVRDAIEFIKYGDYKNQEEYAAVNQSINSIIMESVINPEKAVEMNGKTVEFVGCFTVSDNKTVLITPIQLTEK